MARWRARPAARRTHTLIDWEHLGSQLRFHLTWPEQPRFYLIVHCLGQEHRPYSIPSVSDFSILIINL